jgi:hypothetical protein
MANTVEKERDLELDLISFALKAHRLIEKGGFWDKEGKPQEGTALLKQMEQLYRPIPDIEAVPTDKLCYECGQRLFKYEDRLQCLGQGCGAWESPNLPTTKGQEDARTN